MTAKRKRNRSRKNKHDSWKYLIFFTLLTFILFAGINWWINNRPVFVRYPAFGIAIPEKYQVHGIDVSKHQDNINWEEVAAMKIKNVRVAFSFIKASEGIGNRDKQFRRNWRKAKQAGIVRGAYHFFLATRDGKMQAENFISQVELEEGDLPPVIDVEQTYGVSTARVRTEVKRWLNTVEAYYGIKPIIYTNVDFYKRILGEEFDDYPLWAAHYLQPSQPRIDRDWSFWQHSEEGRVNGIRARVDFNVFNGDSLSFTRLLYKKP